MTEIQKEEIIEVMKKINDPELHIDIWTLKLIYNIEIKESLVDIRMTFTSPMCPYGPFLVDQIKNKIKESLNWVKEVKVEVVFEPLWQPTDEIKEILGIPL
ncbi:MAG: iron-sulfur cluster assembly protein [Nanoarchaeota archaeon]